MWTWSHCRFIRSRVYITLKSLCQQGRKLYENVFVGKAIPLQCRSNWCKRYRSFIGSHFVISENRYVSKDKMSSVASSWWVMLKQSSSASSFNVSYWKFSRTFQGVFSVLFWRVTKKNFITKISFSRGRNSSLVLQLQFVLNLLHPVESCRYWSFRETSGLVVC